MSQIITVKIPSESASRSKMHKKGWKCWAKILTSVKSPANDGYAFEGSFASIGAIVEVDAGAVLLHVDQSDRAAIGVAMINRAGAGFIKWIDSASADARKWCGPLGGPARKLLAMDTDERIRHVAGIIAADKSNPQRTPADQEYYDTLAGLAPAVARPLADQPAAAIENPLAIFSDEEIRAEFARRGL